MNPDMILKSDASKEGWGLKRMTDGTGGRWFPEEASSHINELELQAILFAPESLYTDLKDIHIRIESDNTTAICHINNMGGSKSRKCNTTARNIWFWALNHNVYLMGDHLPGNYNIVADQESRIFNDRTEGQLQKAIFRKLI